MVRSHPAAILATAVALTAVSAAVAAPAQADAIVGKSTNRHGSVTLTFSTDPGWMTIQLSPKMLKRSRAKLVEVECRKGKRYRTVVGLRWLSPNTRIGAPAAIPEGSNRCRIRRSGTVVATMRMRLRRTR